MNEAQGPWRLAEGESGFKNVVFEIRIVELARDKALQRGLVREKPVPYLVVVMRLCDTAIDCEQTALPREFSALPTLDPAVGKESFRLVPR